ncbi:U4/U6 small nuclear ribonucleoprotein Prp31 homolog [Rutidosis leptorrhynchoides]|uniref:U4/U6 small nuclear ribonucleoprotein Prp31 homolog n=1 Tax=Rutidosis leptorrhynchoides TaxID=125765 RepID=UPI003A9A4BC1
MANLEDSFLADLEDLSDNDNENLDPMEDDDHVSGDLATDIEAMINYDDLDSVSKLQKTQRYTDIMKKLENALDNELSGDTEYQLIAECNELSVDIEKEIVIIHNLIRDKYRLKFPELESIVRRPIDYARVVKKIGNEVDLTLVDLQGLLPSATIMVISVIASTTIGKPLPEHVLEKIIEGCDGVLTLDESKKKVSNFFESRMGYIAPNLSAIVGSSVAAKLMVTAGGLSSLVTRAANIELLGARLALPDSLSEINVSLFRVGYLEQTEVIQTTPPGLKKRACRLLAAKSSLAARVDLERGDPSGRTGRRYREEICNKIEKWQEPPPAKQPKPLPVPKPEPKKKRGGRRLRKMKERYGMTDMCKLVNRMPFGLIPEESSLGDGVGQGYGMLIGKLRVSVGKNKLTAKVDKKLKRKQYS